MGRAWLTVRSLLWAPRSAPAKQSKAQPVTIVLVDNGSLRAASTLNLREVASQMESALRGDPSRPLRAVHATSLRFSDRVSADQLRGVLPSSPRRSVL